MSKICASLIGLTLTGALAFTADAADMYVPGPGGYKDSYVPVTSWAGFYVGVNVGAGVLDIDHPSNDIVPSTAGIAGGGQIGYNFQTGPVVFGVEADVSGLGLSANEPCANPAFGCHSKADWIATVRGRLGYAFDRTLVYATAGAAFSELDASTTLGGASFPDNKSLTGYAVGGGIEYMLTPKWVGRFEFLYANFGSSSYTFDTTYKDIKTQIEEIRVGLSYKFGPTYEPLK